MIDDLLIKTVLNIFSPSGGKGQLSILIFHRVLPNPDPIFPDEVHAAFFDEVLGWMKSWFNILPLDEAILALQAGTLPARAACITFDDGYADNYQVALPILKKHDLTATFFIATGFLDGGRMWNDTIIETIRMYSEQRLDLSILGLGIHATGNLEDKRKAIQKIIDQIKYRSLDERISLTEEIATVAKAHPPTDLMMTSEEVIKLRRAGMQIGAHTVSHPILAKTDLETARNEILKSKSQLECLLGEPVLLFAYPNGKPEQDYLFEHVEIVRNAGFIGAVSTKWGAGSKLSDSHQLPRFTPWNKNKVKFGLKMLQNLVESK